MTTPFYGFLKAAPSVSLSILLLITAVTKTSASPLPSRNLHPLKFTYAAAPIRCCSQNNIDQSSWVIDLQHDIVNASYDEQSANEQLLIDAELNRTEFHISYQWPSTKYKSSTSTKSYQVGIALPWVGISGGNTDSTISNWHDWFGFPNGNRDERPSNAIKVSYQRGGEPLVDHTNAISGVADIELYWLSRYQQRSSGFIHSLQIGLSSSILSDKPLISSDTTQLYGQWSWLSQPLLSSLELKHFGRFELRYTMGSGFLNEYREDWAGLSTLGVNLPITARTALVAQWEIQSKTYASELDSLGASASQLSVGIQSRGDTPVNWSLFFTEDTDVNSAPDFGIGFKLGYSL